MAPAYKIVYFDGRGITEPIRYLFKYGGIEFEDVRIKDAEWPQEKEKTPFGYLPYIEHNGKKVGQSIAIARYVAKQVKLVGKDDWENLEIDAIVDTITDLRSKTIIAQFDKDEATRKTLRETLISETIPYYTKRLEEIAQKNNGYLAVGRLTWADLFFAATVLGIDEFIGGDSLSNLPTLKALFEKVNSIPAIKKWIAERPESDF